MSENDWLARQFDESRAHLRGVAYRMLGSVSEADDAVQETWLKLSRSDTHAVENLRGWLTTVVARVCLDMLRSRRSRREEPLSGAVDIPSAGDAERANRTSRRGEQPAEGHDERPLQEAEESLEAIRHD